MVKGDLESYMKKFDCNDDQIKKTLEMFKGAEEITGLAFDDILDGIDFKPNDYKKESLEAFLAELRVIFFLNNIDGKEIIPIASNNKDKSPDFSFSINKAKFIAEVFCATAEKSESKDEHVGAYILPYGKFVEYYCYIAEKKKEQLDAITDVKKFLICVLNDFPYSRLYCRKDYENFLKEIVEKLNWGSDYYFSIVTGLKSNGEDDDIIYPVV